MKFFLYKASIFIALLFFFAIQTSQAVTPAYWAKSSYSYDANDKTIKTVLEDIARSHNLKLKASGTLQKKISGKINTKSTEEFLDRLSSNYGLQWFVFNGTLYISPMTEQTQSKIFLEPASLANEAKAALVNLGLWEQKFGFAVLGEAGAIIVTGPLEYIQLVKKSLLGKRAAPKKTDEVAMIFPLKYADAADKHIKKNNEDVVFPGVATLLRNLLEDTKTSLPDDPAFPVEQNVEQDSAGKTKIGDLFRIPKIKPPGSGTGITGSTGSVDSPSFIQADTRTNSVLIRDKESRRAYYQKLIDQLDVSRQLMNMQLMVLDVDKRRIGALFARLTGNSESNKKALADRSWQWNKPVLLNYAQDWYVQLERLVREGMVTVIANANVVAVENMPTVLQYKEEISGIAENRAPSGETYIGTVFELKPRVISVRSKATTILLDINIEDSRVVGIEDDGSRRTGKSSLQTQSRIQDGQALLIGQHYFRQFSEAAVPSMSLAPIKGKKRAPTYRERLFIIRPSIWDAEQ